MNASGSTGSGGSGVFGGVSDVCNTVDFGFSALMPPVVIFSESVWFDASNLIVTKVDLSDPVRKERFRSLAED